jgi:acyl-coenzyme A synthetase/AMP-(fatty) acid ligase
VIFYTSIDQIHIMMSATTLSNSLRQNEDATAIIVPSKPQALTVSYKQLSAEVTSFQKKLARLGVTPESAVSIALPNTYEFIVAFLAASWQRAIAAPLNPAYKQDEFEFYIDDLKSSLVLVPKGSFHKNDPAVRAARRYKAAIAECYWDAQRREVVLDIKDEGKLKGNGNKGVEQAQPDDIALVLHTSGTTGRPKAVSDTDDSWFKYADLNKGSTNPP